MSPAALRALSVVNGWETVRYELLQTRLCDLGVNIEDSYIADYIERLYHELESKKLVFQPRCYLTDGWGCPDEVPIIGMTFYSGKANAVASPDSKKNRRARSRTIISS